MSKFGHQTFTKKHTNTVIIHSCYSIEEAHLVKMPYQYSVGNQVWLKYDEQWFPAKLIEPSVEFRQQFPGFLCAQYYGTGEFCDAVPPTEEESRMVPFETSSEKNVTHDPELLKAIEAARSDATGTSPAVIEGAGAKPGQKRSRLDGGGEPGPAAASTTRRRTEANPEVKIGDTTLRSLTSKRAAEENRNDNASDRKVHEPWIVRKICEDLNKAALTSDLHLARRSLVALSTGDVQHEDLKETKLGHAVTALLHRADFTPLHEFLRAILRVLFQKLPQQARDVLTRYHEGKKLAVAPSVKQATDQASTTVGSVAAAAAAAGQTQLNQQASYLQSAESQAPSTTQGGAARELEKRIRSILEPEIYPRVHELQQVIQGLPADDRGHFLSTIESNPEIRHRAFNGEITAEGFLSMTFDQLQTAKSADERRRKDELDAQNSEIIGFGDLTRMFTCDVCKGNSCRFLERQMRGGDEPTTKFIYCQNTDCRNSWTLE